MRPHRKSATLTLMSDQLGGVPSTLCVRLVCQSAKSGSEFRLRSLLEGDIRPLDRGNILLDAKRLT